VDVCRIFLGSKEKTRKPHWMHAADDLDFVKLEKIALKTGEICPIDPGSSSSSSFFPSL